MKIGLQLPATVLQGRKTRLAHHPQQHDPAREFDRLAKLAARFAAVARLHLGRFVRRLVTVRIRLETALD